MGGRTSGGWRFIFQCFKVKLLCSTLLSDRLLNMLTNHQNKAQIWCPTRPTTALHCIQALDELLSGVRQIYRDWSPASTHYPWHTTWDKPIFIYTHNTTEWKRHYFGFFGYRGRKQTNKLANLVTWLVHALVHTHCNGGLNSKQKRASVECLEAVPRFST